MNQKQGKFYFKRADERRKSYFDSSCPCGRVGSGMLASGMLAWYRLPQFK